MPHLDWRKISYFNQKNKSSKLKPKKPKEPTSSKATPASSTLIVFILLLAANLIEEANAMKNPSFRDEIHARMVLGGAKNCSYVSSSLITTVREFPPCHRLLTDLLSSSFLFACSTSEEINKILVNGGKAYVSAVKNKIYLADHSLTPEIITHELTHAHNIFLNRQPKCRALSEIDSALPFFPATKYRLKQYTRALNKGDERVKEFQHLINKQAQNDYLTTEEAQLLNSYKHAASDCLNGSYISDVISSDLYDQLIAAGYPPDLKGFAATNDNITLIVKSIQKNKDGTYNVTLYPKDGISSVLYMLTGMASIMNNGMYDVNNKKLMLLERDAYTFQNLSDNARNLFYPEANKLREEHRNQCLSANLSL